MSGERAVLEAIAYGSDVDVRPAERLRAVELLRELDDRGNARQSAPERVTAQDARPVQEQFDEDVAALILAFAYGGDCTLSTDPPFDFPKMRAALNEYHDVRTKAERPVDYGELRVVAPEDDGEVATDAQDVIPPATIDVKAGWPKRRRRKPGLLDYE